MDEPSITIHEVVENLKKIQALCNNPNWESKRRWIIEELALKSLNKLDKIGYPKA